MNNRLHKYRSPGAKRLMLEAQELKDKTEDYCAQPIEDNLFEWHFTVRGPPDTAFEGGYYHGRLSFPTEYPMKPPSIILLTPNGRFETNKKICLSISGYHPETWQPSWSVRTALLALIAFMPTKTNKAIGSLDFPDAERRKLAKNSKTWKCETCGPIKDLLKHPEPDASIFSAGSHICEASTSRLDSCVNSHSEESQDGKSLSGDRSDSDGETRVGSSDSQSSTSTNNSDVEGEAVTKRTVQQPERQDQKDLCVNDASNTDTKDGIKSDINHSASSENGNQSPELLLDGNEQGTGTNFVDGRRSSPSLVFMSIFILLFLLILRRVVMIIMS